MSFFRDISVNVLLCFAIIRNIVSNGDGNDENEEAVDDIKLYDDEEDDEEEHEEREEETEQQKEEDVVGNSIGG